MFHFWYRTKNISSHFVRLIEMGRNSFLYCLIIVQDAVYSNYLGCQSDIIDGVDFGGLEEVIHNLLS